MKINKVKLHNFSSYEGNNEFDFEITDAGKNIVLIGGKNGAGKTSLFTAIKVALYGPLAYGYVGVNSHYISKYFLISFSDASVLKIENFPSFKITLTTRGVL